MIQERLKKAVYLYVSAEQSFDGHKFVAQAAELGAAAVVVEKDVRSTRKSDSDQV